MKKLFALVLSFLVMSTVAFASDISSSAKESKQGTISASQVVSSTVLNGKHVILVNRGANDVYLKLNTDVAVTTSTGFKLKKDESMTLDTANQIYNVSAICAAGETASVQYIAWE